MTDRAIAGLLVFLFAAIVALLPGCGDGEVYTAPTPPQVGQVVRVQSFVAPPRAPEPTTPTTPAPKPINATYTGSADGWTAAGAGALADGVLTSAPALVDPYCGRTDGVAAELSIPTPRGLDCTVSLSGDLAVLRARPWVVGRPGTSVNCNPQDPKTLLSADFGAGPVGISSGSLTFPAVGLSYKVRALGSRVVVRVGLQGDSAARLGAVKVAIRCADTAPDASP